MNCQNFRFVHQVNLRPWLIKWLLKGIQGLTITIQLILNSIHIAFWTLLVKLVIKHQNDDEHLLIDANSQLSSLYDSHPKAARELILKRSRTGLYQLKTGLGPKRTNSAEKKIKTYRDIKTMQELLNNCFQRTFKTRHKTTKSPQCVIKVKPFFVCGR